MQWLFRKKLGIKCEGASFLLYQGYDFTFPKGKERLPGWLCLIYQFSKIPTTNLSSYEIEGCLCFR